MAPPITNPISGENGVDQRMADVDISSEGNLSKISSNAMDLGVLTINLQAIAQAASWNTWSA
jgi:hypothetical protein